VCSSDLLYQHPAVKEVAIICVQHPRWGETVRAVVVRKDGMSLTEQEVIDFAQDKLARYKQPKSVVFIDVLPRNPAGKVLKFDLREEHGQPMVDADAPPAQRATTGAG
jgi:acyl-CoA synthetase (AMP-forming)/AMP-acid ligase II